MMWKRASDTDTPSRRGRTLAASLLAVTLAFTTIPAGSAWATGPGGESGTGDETGTGGESGTGEETEEGVAPAADSEDVPGLAMQVRIASDGTPTWDADSNAGNDSGPNNGIVRVNDTVTYEVEYAVSNTDAANLTWSMTLPKGMEITQLPGYCQATGSSLVPATAGTPTLPLSATSIDELSEQVVTCNMGDRAVATDKVFITAKVLNLAHQGMDLPIVAATVTADGVVDPIPASVPLPTVKSSARLMWDLSKNSVTLEENRGYSYGPNTAACPWDSTRTCKLSSYSVLLSAPAGGKGAMPAVGPVTFTDSLTPASMYPSLSATAIASIDADLGKYGSRVYSYAGRYSQPYTKITPSTPAVNSVRDSGTMTIAQAGPGQAATITIDNADWSLRSFPSQVAQPLGTALPSNAAYAVSESIAVYTPVDTIRDFGTESNGRWTLPTRNTYTDLSMAGFAATDVQTSADQPLWNDYKTTTPVVEVPGGFNKRFVGVTGASGNMTPVEFAPGDASWWGEGPPGGAVLSSGGITVAETQNVISLMYFAGSDASLPAPVSQIGCDAWDNSKLHLAALDVPGTSPGVVPGRAIPSGGKPVWITGYNNAAGVNPNLMYPAANAAQAPDLTVQYSATPGGAGAASICDASTGPWYDSPEQVPGNDPALAAEGIYTGVSRVRVHFVSEPARGNNAVFVRANVAIGMRVADAGLPTGTTIPNWGTVKMVLNQDLTMQEMLAHPRTWGQSTFNADAFTGATGDRLILAHAQARIDKQVRAGDSGDFSSTPPQVTGGDLVQYRLAPSLTSGAMTPGILKDVWVEDCLPGSQSYDSASITPSVVSPGSTPADAKRPACAAGETYIRWVLPDHEVNTVIEPIILSVEVSPTADDGVYTNTVVVWAEDDASTLAQRRDEAQIQIANIAGIKLEKVALTPVVQVNRPEAANQELNRWAVRMTNTLPASEQSGVSSPDIIDVLPRQGVQGTAFSGSFTFKEAVVTQGGPQTRILYTRAANVSANPQDPSNGATGATTWCDAPAGGTRVSGVNGCPTDASQVTGLRIQRAGAYLSGETIEIELSMVGVGNAAGDVYVNRAMASAVGLDNSVGPIRRPETVIASRIGDYVWWDLNRNGVQDEFQGAPEQPAAGITVRLTGTDDLGNAVAVETTTDADGKYSFAGLRASGEGGYTVTFLKPDGSEFTTTLAEGVEPTDDSNADTTTGAAAPLVLPANTVDVTIDAGLMPFGDLQINKSLVGAGAGEYAKDDTLVFDVVCTFDPQLEGVDPVEVLAETVSLDVNGAEAVTSDLLGPLPAYTSCTVTETESGNADEAAAPVTVTVPWDATAQRSGTVTGSLTNFYSAGSVEVAKTLDGDAEAMEAAKDKVFEVLVICQIEELDSEGETVLADVYSGSVLIKGGQTKYLVNESDQPRVLPIGTTCFGEEVNTGGADASVVNHDTFENGVTVTDGDPENLQVLTISAVNTFKNPPPTGALPFTGGQLPAGILLAAVGLLVMGGAILALRRMRRREEEAASSAPLS